MRLFGMPGADTSVANRLLNLDDSNVDSDEFSNIFLIFFDKLTTESSFSVR